MATQLDLQEQEQLDSLKAFWKQYGNLLTWTVIAALAAFAGWNGWNYWQREQGFKAGALYEELDRAVAAGNTERVQRALSDLQSKFPKTVFAEQGALLAAKMQFDKGQPDAARAALTWLADNGTQDEARTIARLRLAALQSAAKQYDEALKTLDAAKAAGFEGLVADRRGDVLLAQGKTAEARAAYQAAWAAMEATLDYRRVVDAKLTALGAAPVPASAPMAASAAAAPAAPVAAVAAASGASK
jgi:predicted negative regulator of RcsB-dependent stress response